MSVLSLTFHCTENYLREWEKYVDETLSIMAENLMDVEKYILSEVESEMIGEGKNFNLLLVFENDELRELFLDNEMKNIEERIEAGFGGNVMIFRTLLNPKKSRY
ncbi:MAG: DUF4286 family protein [Bergeyella sp.]